MKKRFSKFLALVLVAIMIMTALPVSAVSFLGRSSRPGVDNGSGRTFSAKLKNGLTVEVTANENAFPKTLNKIKMVANAVQKIDAVQAAVDNTEGVSGRVLAAVDISFYNGRKKIQPSEPVTVTLTSDDLNGCRNLSIVHLNTDEKGLTRSMPLAELVKDVTYENGSVVFNASSFSIFAGIDGDTGNRITVDFYSDSNEHINKQIVLTGSLVEGNSPVYDPGMPTLDENQAFGGWRLVGSGLAPAGFEYGKTYTVNKINQILIQNKASYTADFAMNFQAVVEDVVFVSYTDQNGVVWQTVPVPLNHGTSGDFEYDDTFSPVGQNVGLVGWVVMFEDDVATGNVVEDNEGSFKYKVVAGAEYHAPGSDGVTAHELVLFPLVKSGAWLSFDSNIGTSDTTPATYTAPRFIAEGEAPANNQPADPTRDGYDFGGWYTTADLATEFNWNDTDWQSQLTNNKVYAKWNAKSGIPYTVIYWTQNRDDDYNASNDDKSWDYYVPTARGVVTEGTATAGTTVTLTSSTSGKVAYNRLGRNSETYSGREDNGELGYYYKFNSALTETSKVIRGDGTTVFNVYYDRATITINFYTSYTNGSYSGFIQSFTGLYEHELPSNFAVVGGYPNPGNGYSWAMYNKNVNETWTLTNVTAPTCFKSFVECSETWNIHKVESSSYTGKYMYFMTQNLSGNYVQFRSRTLNNSVTQNIGGLEYYGFTGIGYYLNGNYPNSMTTFNAADDPVVHIAGSDVGSNGAYIYYQRNSWKFDYRSVNETTPANNGNSIYYQADISGYGSYVPTNGPRGCYFTGWYKDPACTQPFTFTGATMPNHDVIVYAGWEHEWYRVVFDLTDNGKVAPETITIPGTNQDTSFCMEYGKKVDGSSLGNITTSAGYTFGGWFYDAAHTKPFNFDTEIGPDIPTAGDPDGMDMTYANWPDSQRQGGDHWKTWSDVGYPGVRGYIKLYALWRQQVVGSDGIQVRYDAVEGDGLIYVNSNGQVIRYDPFTYTDGALAFTRYSATPNEDGEQFLYWEILDKNGNVVRTVYPGETFPVNLEWAVAEAARPTYTITWHFLTTNGWDSVTTTVSEGDIPSHGAASVEYNGSFYRFTGNWNTAQDGSGTPPAAAEANAEYYAQYTVEALPEIYTVTFVDHDGTVLSTQQVYEGDSATAPADPTRTGYTFTGWSPADFSNVTSNMTITAQYTVNSYTLTINYLDGNNNTVAASYTGTYNFGAAYNVASPEVEGYTTEQTTVEGTMPARNVTVNVVYTAVATEKVYQLLTSAPSDWAGNYVITNNTTDLTTSGLYVMKGINGTSSGADFEVVDNRTAFASTGITLNDNKLTGVSNDYVFTIAASGSYYTLKSAATNAYIGMYSSSKLAAYSGTNYDYTNWTPAINSSGVAQMKCADNGSYPYLGWSTSNNYFWSASTSNANALRLWKEVDSSGSGTTTTVTYEKTTSLSSGDDVIIVVGSYAVGNTAVTSNHYLSANSVSVSGTTLTLGSTSEAAVLWQVGGSSSAWTFYNQSARKYLGYDSSYYLAPTDAGSGSDWYWTYDGTDLNNHCTASANLVTSTSSDYYGQPYLYLTYSSNGYFTTTPISGQGIQFFKKVVTPTSVQPSPAEKTKNDRAVEDLILDQRMIDSEARTTAPEASRETAPTASRANNTYTKVTTLTPGKRYLISYTSGSTAYVMSNQYYSGNYRPSIVQATVSSNTITGDYDDYLFGLEYNSTYGYRFGSLSLLTYLSGAGSDNSYYPYFGSESGYTTRSYWQLTSNKLKNYGTSYYLGYQTSNGVPVCFSAYPSSSNGDVITFYERVEDTVSGETFNLTSDLVVGNKYIIAIGDFAVGNLPVNNSGNDYFINGNRGAVSGSTITLASADVDDSTWEIVSGDATNGFVFKNVGNDKYLGMSSDGQCYLAATTLDKAANWTYDGTDLNNNVTETANYNSSQSKYYYYLSFSTTLMDFTTSVATGQNVKFYAVPEEETTHTLTIVYEYADHTTAATTYSATYAEGASYSVTSPTIEGYTPSQAVVSGTMNTSDINVTVTYTQNGGGTVTQKWTPTDTIVVGEDYLIGLVVYGEVFLIPNDGQYKACSIENSDLTHYLGYTAWATLDSDNVHSAHVTGINDVNEMYTDLSSCIWTFSESTGGLIQAANGKYLATYNSSNYLDLYAKSSSTYGTNWYYDAADYSLSRQIRGTRVYVRPYFIYDDNDNVTNSLMGVSTTDITSDDVYIQLYSLRDVVEGETYTVSFTYYDENGELTTVTYNNVAYGQEITPPVVPDRDGYTFNGWDAEGYLSVTESHNYVAQYIQDNSYTYTVYLRAVYGIKNTTGLTTIVLDANGLTFVDQDTAIGILNRSTDGVTPWGTVTGGTTFTYSSDRISLNGVDINGAVNLPNDDMFTQKTTHGYRIIGWNTKPDGSGMWIKFDGTGDIGWGNGNNLSYQKVFLDNLDRTDVNTHVNTLYAMWEGYSYVYHSADNTIDRFMVYSTDVSARVNDKLDLVELTNEKIDVLYGGYTVYSTGYYGGLIGNSETITTGRIDWTNSYTATVNGGKAYNPWSAYATGLKKWWKASSMATAPGNAVTPVIGEIYIIKEVDDQYLPIRCQYIFDKGNKKISELYALTLTDDKLYSEVGIRVTINGETTSKSNTLAGSVTIKNPDGTVASTVTPKTFPNMNLGWVCCVNCDLPTSGGFIVPIAEDNPVFLEPYWITPDGITVTSPNTRNFWSTDGTVDGLGCDR